MLPSTSSRRLVSPPLLAAALIALAYLPSLQVALFGDDFELLDAGFRALHDPLQLLHRTGLFFRPLVKLTLLANWLVGGIDPIGYNLTNLGLHVLNVALLAVLVARLSGRGWLGMSAAVLWGSSPLYSGATLWSSSRGDLLVAGCSRAALWGLVWMLLALAPSVPIRYAASRYNYLPLIGFWIMITALAAALAQRVVAHGIVRRPVALVVATGAVVAVVAVQIAQLQLEIEDYRRLAAAHTELLSLVGPSVARLDVGRPVVLLNLGARQPLTEVEAERRGHLKLLFARRDGLWQLIRFAPLVNVLGDPWRRLLEPVPPSELPVLLAGNPLVVGFTDRGFALGDSDAARVVAERLASDDSSAAAISGYRWRRWRS